MSTGSGNRLTAFATRAPHPTKRHRYPYPDRHYDCIFEKLHYLCNRTNHFPTQKKQNSNLEFSNQYLTFILMKPVYIFTCALALLSLTAHASPADAHPEPLTISPRHSVARITPAGDTGIITSPKAHSSTLYIAHLRKHISYTPKPKRSPPHPTTTATPGKWCAQTKPFT